MCLIGLCLTIQNRSRYYWAQRREWCRNRGDGPQAATALWPVDKKKGGVEAVGWASLRRTGGRGVGEVEWRVVEPRGAPVELNVAVAAEVIADAAVASVSIYSVQ